MAHLFYSNKRKILKFLPIFQNLVIFLKHNVVKKPSRQLGRRGNGLRFEFSVEHEGDSNSQSNGLEQHSHSHDAEQEDKARLVAVAGCPFSRV